MRFAGTYDLEVTLRLYNTGGNYLTTSPYRTSVSAAAHDWNVQWDTGWLDAVGEELEYTAYTTHVWPNLPLYPNDTLTLTLDDVSRQTSSFWPQLFVQFLRVRLTVNASDDADAYNVYSNWYYGDRASPFPPPPP